VRLRIDDDQHLSPLSEARSDFLVGNRLSSPFNLEPFQRGVEALSLLSQDDRRRALRHRSRQEKFDGVFVLSTKHKGRFSRAFRGGARYVTAYPDEHVRFEARLELMEVNQIARSPSRILKASATRRSRR
jgi:hypothetical protein